jgi:p-cymene monooxygenase electron transfer component
MAGFLRRLFAKAAPQPVHIRPFGADVQVEPEQTVLEAALGAGIAFPHSCTVGTCGSCKCRLVSGEVRAVSDFGYTLSQEELAAGFILACQAIPKAPLVLEVASPAADAPEPETFSGRILERRALTHDILSVTVALDRPMRYVAGQFANLVVDGLPARSYSFADAPERAGRGKLRFFIRKVPGGAFTERLFAGTLDSAEIAVNGPHGTFYLRPGTGPILAIAGGSGLAPILSLLNAARANNIRRPCTLMFGARTKNDLYALAEIEELGSSWPADFNFLPVLSEEAPDSGWMGRTGLVTEHIGAVVRTTATQGNQSYMCGPPAMIDRAITVLTGLGQGLDTMFYDKFVDSREGVGATAVPALSP